MSNVNKEKNNSQIITTFCNELFFLFTEGPPKPKFPKMLLEYVNDDAKAWIANLVDVVQLREIKK